MSRSIIPDAVAREPWHVILPLFALNTFGSVVLHSAAGGHLNPWALLHTIHFLVFLGMAVQVLANTATEPAGMVPEKRLFKFSIVYLFVLFGAAVADRWLLA